MKRRGRGERRTLVNMMDETVWDQGIDGELWPEERLDKLMGLADRADLDMWIGYLRRAETSVRRFRKRLEALRDGHSPLRCPVCDSPVSGRADAVYCGDVCRLRAWRDRARADGHGDDAPGGR